MDLIRKYNEFMGPKDERLEAESSRYLRIGYAIFTVGCLLCIYYGVIVSQVASVAEVELYTAAGQRMMPLYEPLMVVTIMALLVPCVLQARAGIVSEHARYAQADAIPWDIVVASAFIAATVVGVLTVGFRMLAEVQIVGIQNVMWLGDIAVGVVFFVMVYVLTFVFMGLMFREAIKRRQRLEAQLEDGLDD